MTTQHKTRKVDTLRHIHDHGLAVEFTDPKLIALVASLQTDGAHKITAGESSLTVLRNGRVTVTLAHWSVGNYHRQSIHYYDPAAGLKYSLARGDNDDAYDTLRASIFGGHDLPYFLSGRNNGATRDELHAWADKWAWCLTGEAGMRAQAIKQTTDRSDAAITSAKNAHAFEGERLARLTSRTPEHYTERHASLRERAARDLVECDARNKKLNDQLIAVSTATEDQLRDISGEFGAWNLCIYDGSGTGSYRHGWAGTSDSVNPGVASPNYSATLGADGETITLSSGIACPFTKSALLAWLRGGAEIQTRYGPVRKLPCADLDHTPRVLLTCGCHRVNPGDIGEDVAALCQPTHRVEVVKGKPAVYLTPETVEQFRAELVERIGAAITANTEERADVLRRLASGKHDLTTEQAELPARIEAQTARVAECAAEVEKAEAARAALIMPIGQTDAQEIGSRILHALAGGYSHE